MIGCLATMIKTTQIPCVPPHAAQRSRERALEGHARLLDAGLAE